MDRTIRMQLARAVLCLSLLPTLAGCALFRQGGGGQPTTTGALSVAVGFSAPSGVRCTGQAAVTLSPRQLTGATGRDGSMVATVTFDGHLSGTLDAGRTGCQASAVFDQLRTGLWEARVDGVSPGPVACPASVATQLGTVQVWNGACF